MSQLRLHSVDSSRFARFANAKEEGAGDIEELLREAVQWSCSIELLMGAVLKSCSNKIDGGAQGSVCAQESWSATLRSQVGARAGWSTACSIPCPGCVTQKRSACHELDALRPRDTGRAGLVCPIYPLTLASQRSSLRLATRRFHYKTKGFEHIP